jgi:hypothetical protein
VDDFLVPMTVIAGMMNFVQAVPIDGNGTIGFATALH